MVTWCHNSTICTIVLWWQLSTGSLHDYIFCYCPIVGILFKVMRILCPSGFLSFWSPPCHFGYRSPFPSHLHGSKILFSRCIWALKILESPGIFCFWKSLLFINCPGKSGNSCQNKSESSQNREKYSHARHNLWFVQLVKQTVLNIRWTIFTPGESWKTLWFFPPESL